MLNLMGTSNNLDSRIRGHDRWLNHGAKRIKTSYSWIPAKAGIQVRSF